MSTVTKKSFYIVATVNGEHFFHEGQFTEQEINKVINEFDIDEFLADEATDEEFSGPAEGHYAVYRQSMMTDDEALAIGYADKFNEQEDGSFSMSYTLTGKSPAVEALYEKRKAEIEAEVEAEFGDAEPIVCLKSFAKVVA